MSDLKISQLTALAAVDVASTDVLPIVDTSATTTKKITAASVATYVAGTTDITNLLAAKQDVVSGVDSTEIGYLNGVTSAIQTQLDNKVAATVVDSKGDLLVGSADNTVARLQVGTNAYVLTANSGATYGVEWAAVPAPAADSENAILAAAVFI